MFAEIVPEIKVSNKTEFMIECQLATRSESPQLGQNNHYQTLPKAQGTQVLTALTSNFGLVGLVQ